MSPDEPIHPATVIRVEGKGMCAEGDLFVHFDIEFPEFLELEKKEKIKKILENDK